MARYLLRASHAHPPPEGPRYGLRLGIGASDERGKTAVRIGIFIAIGQGWYFLASGLWPVLHLRSFVAVTGPKTDYWLVQAFGVLVAAVGAVFLVRGIQARIDATTRQFGLATSLALAAIDFWFVSAGAISAIYLADAAVEMLLAVAWLWSRAPRLASPRP